MSREDLAAQVVPYVVRNKRVRKAKGKKAGKAPLSKIKSKLKLKLGLTGAKLTAAAKKKLLVKKAVAEKEKEAKMSLTEEEGKAQGGRGRGRGKGRGRGSEETPGAAGRGRGRGRGRGSGLDQKEKELEAKGEAETAKAEKPEGKPDNMGEKEQEASQEPKTVEAKPDTAEIQLQVEVGQTVKVDHVDAPSHLAGVSGVVVEKAGGFVKLACAGSSKSESKELLVAACFVSLAPEGKPATRPLKNLAWLDQPLCLKIRDSLALPDDFQPVKRGTMLTNNQVEAGIAHSLWSVLPGKVAVISSAWLTICVEANTKGDFALLHEDFCNLTRQRDTVCKSELILCPILVQEPVKHWTLLVLERSKAEAAAPASSTKVEAESSLFGCPSCRHSPAGCLRCNPSKFQEHADKKQRELLQFSTEDWPFLPETKNWQVRYYDSLTSPVATSSAMACAVLNVFSRQGLPQALPAPEKSKSKQTDGWSCGLFVVLYAEEEVRKYAGEPCDSMAPPPPEKDRINRLNAFLARMNNALKAAK